MNHILHLRNTLGTALLTVALLISTGSENRDCLSPEGSASAQSGGIGYFAAPGKWKIAIVIKLLM